MEAVEASPRPDPVDDGTRSPAETHHSSTETNVSSTETETHVPSGEAHLRSDAPRHPGGDQAPEEAGAGLGATTGEMGEGKDPLRFSNWMKRSATGAVMTGIAVGLKEALQPQRKEVPFVIESRDDPDDPDKPIDLHFDPDSPEATVAIIRRPAAGAAPADPPPAP